MIKKDPKQEKEIFYGSCLKIIIEAPNFKEGMSNITQFDFKSPIVRFELTSKIWYSSITFQLHPPKFVSSSWMAFHPWKVHVKPNPQHNSFMERILNNTSPMGIRWWVHIHFVEVHSHGVIFMHQKTWYGWVYVSIIHYDLA